MADQAEREIALIAKYQKLLEHLRPLFQNADTLHQIYKLTKEEAGIRRNVRLVWGKLQHKYHPDKIRGTNPSAKLWELATEVSFIFCETGQCLVDSDKMAEFRAKQAEREANAARLGKPSTGFQSDSGEQWYHRSRWFKNWGPERWEDEIGFKTTVEEDFQMNQERIRTFKEMDEARRLELTAQLKKCSVEEVLEREAAAKESRKVKSEFRRQRILDGEAALAREREAALNAAQKDRELFQAIKLRIETAAVVLPRIVMKSGLTTCKVQSDAASEDSVEVAQPSKSVHAEEVKISGGKRMSALECGFCCRLFNNTSAKSQHIATKHRGIKFTCESCNKEFSSRQYLNLHSKIHMPQQRFACIFCDVIVARSQHLTRHLKRKHAELI